MCRVVSCLIVARKEMRVSAGDGEACVRLTCDCWQVGGVMWL